MRLASLALGWLCTTICLGQAANPDRNQSADSTPPITSSGFVDHGPIIFEDVTKSAGLTGWSHHVGDDRKAFIAESLGSGVALLDYDNDGWMDIYLVNGLTYSALAGTSPPQHAALFRNNHDGTFTDVTAKAERFATDRVRSVMNAAFRYTLLSARC